MTNRQYCQTPLIRIPRETQKVYVSRYANFCVWRTCRVYPNPITHAIKPNFFRNYLGFLVKKLRDSTENQTPKPTLHVNCLSVKKEPQCVKLSKLLLHHPLVSLTFSGLITEMFCQNELLLIITEQFCKFCENTIRNWRQYQSIPGGQRKKQCTKISRTF